jgi:hypothetical protein
MPLPVPSMLQVAQLPSVTRTTQVKTKETHLPPTTVLARRMRLSREEAIRRSASLGACLSPVQSTSPHHHHGFALSLGRRR